MSFLFSQNELSNLNKLLGINCDRVTTELGIEMCCGRNYRFSPCPTHGGDNPTGLNIYHEAENPFWRCVTRGCHKFFKTSLIGMVRGIFSHRHHNWTCGEDKETYSFPKTIDWCMTVLGLRQADLAVEDCEADKLRFTQQMNKMLPQPVASATNISRDYVRKNLVFPADYLLRRGFSEQILENYCIGFCDAVGKPFSDRIVVPIFDQKGQYIIGFTARSIFDKCDSCNLWHDNKKTCPTEQHKLYYCKWRNHGKLNGVLYNLWGAAKRLKETGTLIIVEGPLDCLKVVQAGFENVIALLGSNFSERHQILIERMPLRRLVIMADNDDAGNKLRESIYEKCHRLYELELPQYAAKDPGELSAAQLKEILL